MLLRLQSPKEGSEVLHSTVAPLYILFYLSGQAKSSTKQPTVLHFVRSQNLI